MIGVVIVKGRFINLLIFVLMALIHTVCELDSKYVLVMDHSAAALFLVKSAAETANQSKVLPRISK